MKNKHKIVKRAMITAAIAFGGSCLSFIGLLIADNMYQQTRSDIWGTVIFVMVCAVAHAITMANGVVYYLYRKRGQMPLFSVKIMLLLSEVAWVGFMLGIFPVFYNIFEGYITGSEWGSDLLLWIILGSALLIAGIEIFVLGLFVVYEYVSKLRHR